LKQNTKTNTTDLKSESSVVFDPSDEEEKIELSLIDKINSLTEQEFSLFLSRALLELNLQFY
jgi:hypothetical protein